MPEFNLRAFAGGAGASGALHPCLRAEAEVRLGARLPLKNFTGPGSRAPCAELVQPLPDFLDARSSTAAESRSPSNRIPHQAVPLLVQAPLPGFASVCKIEPHANSLRHPGTAGNSRPLPFITVSGGTFRLPGRSTRASPFLPKSSCPRAATEPASRHGPPPRSAPAVAAAHHRVGLPAANSRHRFLRRPLVYPRTARNPPLPGSSPTMRRISGVVFHATYDATPLRRRPVRLKGPAPLFPLLHDNSRLIVDRHGRAPGSKGPPGETHKAGCARRWPGGGSRWAWQSPS